MHVAHSVNNVADFIAKVGVQKSQPAVELFFFQHLQGGGV